MEKYSIINFLESLADDEIEKVMIKLISEGDQGEDLLNQILERAPDLIVEQEK